MTSKTIFTAICLTLAAFISGADAADTPKPQTAQKSKNAVSSTTTSQVKTNYKISFAIAMDGMERAGNFIVGGGTQGNYVYGGENPLEVTLGDGKKVVDFKKFGTIFNCLVTKFSPGLVNIQMQIEVSGPVADNSTTLKTPAIKTFQIQTEITLGLGRSMLLVDEPDRRIEIKIEELK